MESIKELNEEIIDLKGQLAMIKGMVFGARGCLKAGTYGACAKLLDDIIKGQEAEVKGQEAEVVS